MTSSHTLKGGVSNGAKNMVWKKLKKFEDWNVALIGIVAILCLLIGVLLGYLVNPNPAKEKSIVCYNMASINETLNIITTNCGSTFFTKQYGSNDWSIFQSNVCDGKKCESKYVPLQECINGGEGK